MSANPKRQPIQFGKYLLLDRVNIGGMAEVWRAKMFGAGGFERLVAVKRILPNVAEDREFIEMFIDEAKITVQLTHSNIAQIYDLDDVNKNYYIAMEYVSGRDLRALFDQCRKRGEPAPVPLVCYVISKCCEGLDYAHRCKDRAGREMNLVHRDVSPQNVLLSYDGEVKVIDFGIAKAATKVTKTKAGILKGKFGYMSPEQIRGTALDRRSDIFALGICLYELLTGERLFVGDSDFSVLEKIRRAEVAPPSQFNKKIPEQLERVVLKALAKLPEDRYAYASEIGEDLQRFLLTQEVVFGRKDLAAFMQATFAEDFERENARLAEYNEIREPEQQLSTDADSGPSVLPDGEGSALQASPSALTAVPLAHEPSSARPTAPSAPILPPVRTPSQPNATLLQRQIPRLTVMPPASVTEKPEHASTINGAPSFESGPYAPPPISAPAEQSGVPLGMGSNELVSVASTSGKRNELAGPSGVPDTVVGAPALRPQEPRPTRPSAPRSLEQAPRSTRLVFSLVITAALALGVSLAGALAIVFKPPPKGVLFLNLPPDLAGKAVIEINGVPLTERDGRPLQAYPTTREVTAGKVTVMIRAPGYKAFIRTAEVKAGNDFTEIGEALEPLR